jgi:hypothetical protein
MAAMADARVLSFASASSASSSGRNVDTYFLMLEPMAAARLATIPHAAHARFLFLSQS